jgi:hypothetical protein
MRYALWASLTSELPCQGIVIHTRHLIFHRTQQYYVAFSVSFQRVVFLKHYYGSLLLIAQVIVMLSWANLFDLLYYYKFLRLKKKYGQVEQYSPCNRFHRDMTRYLLVTALQSTSRKYSFRVETLSSIKKNQGSKKNAT